MWAVGETGGDEFAGAIEHLRIRGHVHLGAWTDGGNAARAHEHHRIVHRFSSRMRKHGAADQGEFGRGGTLTDQGDDQQRQGEEEAHGAKSAFLVCDASELMGAVDWPGPGWDLLNG